MVIAPDFTEESEVDATRYHAPYFDRNIVLITAGELKSLAEEWKSRDNKNREQGNRLGRRGGWFPDERRLAVPPRASH